MTRARTNGLIGSKSLPGSESNAPPPFRTSSVGGLIGSKRLSNPSHHPPHGVFSPSTPSQPPLPPSDQSSERLDGATGLLSSLSELSSPDTSSALAPYRVIVKDKETGRAYALCDAEDVESNGKQTLVDLATNSQRTFKYTTLSLHTQQPLPLNSTAATNSQAPSCQASTRAAKLGWCGHTLVTAIAVQGWATDLSRWGEAHDVEA
jgi:hypothetical protein